MAELSDATKHVIVLVIDEAQHAITTEAGAATLFALKAARDQLNGSAHYGFRLIATGSNRDKLSLLVQGKDQAFLNAVLMDLEPLGDDYLKWELDLFDGDAKPSFDTVRHAFAASGFRPETLRKALDDLAFKFDVSEANVDIAFQKLVDKNMTEAKQGFMRQVNSLPPMQAAVSIVMAKMGVDFAPFRPHTAEMYANVARTLARDDIKIDDSSIQYALDALRTKSLIWKSARGVYAIEDSQHLTWLSQEKSQ